MDIPSFTRHYQSQFDRLGEHYEQLGALIGQQAAIETVIAALGSSEPCQPASP